MSSLRGRVPAFWTTRVAAVQPPTVRAGKRGTVQDIASAVCYLASAEAGYITGHSMVMDGGWRAK